MGKNTYQYICFLCAFLSIFSSLHALAFWGGFSHLYQFVSGESFIARWWEGERLLPPWYSQAVSQEVHIFPIEAKGGFYTGSLYIYGDVGIWKSIDDGIHWESIFPEWVDFFERASKELSPEFVEVYVSSEVSISGEQRVSGEVQLIHPLYAWSDDGICGKFSRSFTDGRNWKVLSDCMIQYTPNITKIKPFWIDPYNSLHIFVKWGWIYESFDGGETFFLMEDFILQSPSLHDPYWMLSHANRELYDLIGYSYYPREN